MSQDCCPSNSNVMILACSGGSNVGQLTNQAAIELTKEGFGNMFCLAGIGGRLSGFVQSARDVPQMVLIDGCDIGCGKAAFEHAKVPLVNYLVVTELGIDKNKDFNLNNEDIQKVKDAVRETCRRNRPVVLQDNSDGCCCC